VNFLRELPSRALSRVICIPFAVDEHHSQDDHVPASVSACRAVIQIRLGAGQSEIAAQHLLTLLHARPSVIDKAEDGASSWLMRDDDFRDFFAKSLSKQKRSCFPRIFDPIYAEYCAGYIARSLAGTHKYPII